MAQPNHTEKSTVARVARNPDQRSISYSGSEDFQRVLHSEFVNVVTNILTFWNHR